VVDLIRKTLIASLARVDTVVPSRYAPISQPIHEQELL